MLLLTLMLSGRAMTLAFLHRAGAGGPGDPPAAWLAPLVGDALVGLAALFIAYLILKRRTPLAWTAIITWNVVAIFDAGLAYLVHTTAPWPEFFMIRIFGAWMFPMAIAMHLALIGLAATPSVRRDYRVATPT